MSGSILKLYKESLKHTHLKEYSHSRLTFNGLVHMFKMFGDKVDDLNMQLYIMHNIIYFENFDDRCQKMYSSFEMAELYSYLFLLKTYEYNIYVPESVVRVLDVDDKICQFVLTDINAHARWLFDHKSLITIRKTLVLSKDNLLKKIHHKQIESVSSFIYDLENVFEDEQYSLYDNDHFYD